jgi:DNA-binding IclR family transcriptional regulator
MVSSRTCTFLEIFKEFDRFEEYAFLGDTACQRILDRLVERGFLSQSGDDYRIG